MIKTSLFFLSLILIVSLSSCKKYENGPSLSFRSRTARLENNWKVASYTINGIDFTTALTSINYTESYDKDGNYAYSSSVDSGSGKWAFQSDDEQIKRSGVSGQSSVDLFILKLKVRDFWYYFLDGNDRHEIHLVEY